MVHLTLLTFTISWATIRHIMEDVWFQQDDATTHLAKETIDDQDHVI